MKIYKKEELEYKDGYIVKGDEVLELPADLCATLDALELDCQRAAWKREHKLPPVPKVPEFERKSEFGPAHVLVEPLTPNLDEFVTQAEKIMAELDDVEAGEKVNAYLKKIEPVFRFVNGDSVVASGACPWRFDLPTVGNPLELTEDKVIGLVFGIFGYGVHSVNDDGILTTVTECDE